MGHPFKDTISLQEAVQYSAGPLAFNLMIKPAGTLCNLDCHYCYYLDKAEILSSSTMEMCIHVMARAVMSKFSVIILQYGK